jgi:peroxiredoxin family protein
MAEDAASNTKRMSMIVTRGTLDGAYPTVILHSFVIRHAG